MEEVTIEKLVLGGQGIGRLNDGKVVFVWNALPGEKVKINILKKRKDYSEAIAVEIIEPSEIRQKPKDASYMSSSPWQIMDIKSENKFKLQILEETLDREKVKTNKIEFCNLVEEWNYRNKMEYSFWADDNGLSLALHNRGTHKKIVIKKCSIAREEIDEAASKIIDVLNKKNIRGSQLKTLVLRCSQIGEVIAILFVKDEKFAFIEELESICKGVEVCYSNPKSPASVKTKVLFSYGFNTLTENILGKELTYDAYSFFQINVHTFEKVLAKIKGSLRDFSKVDLYSGVGSIGVLAGNTKYFVDVDDNNYNFAVKNVGDKSKVIKASTEKALDYISSELALMVDPPRAGLHTKLIDKIMEIVPPKITYLSCNPSTQARDLSALQEKYEIESIEGFNFFPKTPHIESLAVMIKK